MGIVIVLQLLKYGIVPFFGGFHFILGIVWITFNVCLRFPLGLVNPLIVISSLPQHPDYYSICFIISIFGWIFYGYIAVAGFIHPTRKRFIVLCLLLMVNIIGTILPHSDFIVPMDLG